MADDEDWDAPPKNPPKPSTPQQSSNSTPQANSTPQTTSTTLKITDGYKYSYEALASPANIDDWVEPLSYGGYGGSRHSSSGYNGFSQNSSFSRDNNRDRPPRNDRRSNNDRYRLIKIL